MRLQISLGFLVVLLAIAACGDPAHYSRAAKGALIGGAVGTDAGALVGYANGDPITGAVVGAGVGAAGGTAISAGLEDQADQLHRGHVRFQAHRHVLADIEDDGCIESRGSGKNGEQGQCCEWGEAGQSGEQGEN